MTRAIVTGALIAAGFVGAAHAQATGDTRKTNDAAAQTIPKDAVDNGNGTWTWTDKDGKKWTYARTAFGLERTPARAAIGAALPPGVPKDAVANPDGTYTATDKDGKKWNYRNTPFGISKAPWTGPPSTLSGADAGVKATDKGSTVRFERQGAFGPVVWEKKKTELTDEERRIFEAQRAKSQ